MVALHNSSSLVLAPEPRNKAGLPAPALAHYRRGNSLYRKGDYAKALQEYDAALESQPEFAEAHNDRGAALSRLGRYDEALAAFDRVLALRPDFAQAHCNAGLALSCLERYDEALAAFDRVLALHPDFAQAHHNRGVSLFDMERYQEALAALDRALALGLDDERTRMARATVMKKLLRGLASGGRAAWLGRPPLGAKRPLRLKPGSPTVAEAIIEDRR